MNPSPSIPEILSPPLSPPALNRGPQRSIAKTSALKLVTSFGDQGSKSKFFSTNDGGQTPIAAGVTPIAESAISPRAEEMSTAFLRPSNRSAFNTPTTARPQGNFNRGRLPSIGEMPSDNNLRHTARLSAKPALAIEALTPPSDSSAQYGHSSKRSTDERNFRVGLALQRAATASPMMMSESPRRRDPPPPSPGPESQAALLASGRSSRNGPRDRMPNGLELQLQSLDNAVASDVTSPEQSVTSARFHWPTRRRGPGSISSATSGAVSAISSTSNGAKQHRGHGQKSLDDYISSIEAAKVRSRGNSRDGRSKNRDSSRTRKEGSRERSADDRGRTSSRGYTPRGGKRSPRSPVPMSPEDLLNLSTPNKYDEQGDEPSTVRKPSTVRASSKSRARRESSRDERRPPAIEIPRGRSNGRQESRPRSPSSPVPMSAGGAQHFEGSEDEEDFRRAMEEQTRFRNKAARSRDGTRGGSKSREPSPAQGVGREVSESRRREHNSSVEPLRVRTPAVRFTAAVHAGDLRTIKDERQLKKEAAARELEERRKSLAKRPLAPPIPHPDQLSPALSARSGMSIQRAPTAPPPASADFELPSTTFVQHKEMPPRSRTAEPEKRSMYAQQPTRPVIGLPATPKALRLVMETQKVVSPDEPVPPIPTTFAQAESPQSPHRNSPQKENPSPRNSGGGGGGGGGLLTLLPSTVYQPPTRPGIQRCVSAPPEEPVPPQALQGNGAQGMGRLARGMSLRKLSTPDSHSNYRRATDDNNVGRSTRRPSQDDQIPPPPPPPPVLKELAHLAIPPPPPPAPLPFAQHAGKPPVVYGGRSGSVEIVMDSEDHHQQDGINVVPLAETTVPVLAAPAPPPSRGHHRGRSSVDNSIAGRISRATERLRSSSRSRNNSSVVSRTKSPIDTGTPAPYESIGAPTPPQQQPQQQPHGPPVSYHNRELRSPIDGRPLRDLPTGMNPGDLI